MGSRAEERFEHDVFSACPVRLRLVHAETRDPPIRRGGVLLCACAALEAAGDRISISALAVGLLAALPDWRSGCGRGGSARRERTGIEGRMAGTRKGATPAALGRERGSDDEGPEGRRRDPDFFSLQPALAFGECADLVCALSGEGALAIEAGGSVSAPRQTLSCMASRRGGVLIDAHHRLGHPRARSTVSCRRMVLVPGQSGADDRAGPGGLSGNGGSPRLPHITLAVSH